MSTSAGSALMSSAFSSSRRLRDGRGPPCRKRQPERSRHGRTLPAEPKGRLLTVVWRAFADLALSEANGRTVRPAEPEPECVRRGACHRGIATLQAGLARVRLGEHQAQAAIAAPGAGHRARAVQAITDALAATSNGHGGHRRRSGGQLRGPGEGRMTWAGACGTPNGIRTRVAIVRVGSPARIGDLR